MSTYFNDTICTPEQSVLAGTSHLECLSHQLRIGLLVDAISAFLSLVAVLWVFARILGNVIRHARSSPKGWRLIKVPMDLYMLSLFTADLFHALGMILEVKWIHDRKVRSGGFCTVQGIALHLGETALAITTIVITLHTFTTVLWGKPHTLAFARIIVGLFWLCLILYIAVLVSTRREPPFYAPTPYWCWISGSFQDHRIAGEYAWLWLALLSSLLYIPLILWSRGYINPSDHWWKISARRQEEDPDLFRAMVVCALAYAVPVLPFSIARWIQFELDAKSTLSSAVIFGGNAILSLSGVWNVVVFLLVRQRLLLFPSPPGDKEILSRTLPDERDVGSHS